MAAIHGKNTRVYLNASDLTAYLRKATLARTADMAETSVYLTDSKSYIPGMVDGTVTLEGLFDGSEAAVDETLEALLGVTTPPLVTVAIGTPAVGSVAHCAVGNESTYDIETSTSDVSTASMELQSNSSVERCLIHKVLAAVDTGNDGDGTAIDNAASSAFGGVGYLHVTAVSGGSLVVKVQHSADNSVWADLITFTASTAVGSERKTVTGTVNRYTRVSDAITASTQTYVMAFGRYTYAH